jgi:hypothetical protein
LNPWQKLSPYIRTEYDDHTPFFLIFRQQMIIWEDIYVSSVFILHSPESAGGSQQTAFDGR